MKEKELEEAVHVKNGEIIIRQSRKISLLEEKFSNSAANIYV